ncbi:MAG: hypothetical protein WCO07_02710 [bacterium]
MDIFAHALWASAGAKKLNDSLEKKEKPKISIYWSAFWSIFPDIFAFGVPTMWSTVLVVLGGKSISEISHHGPHLSAGDPTFNLASYLYQYSHSIIIFLIVFGIVWLIFKKPKLVMLGWLLHIILDIPSHSLQFFPTPFLFPISDYHFPYGIIWSNTWFMIINYSLLLVILMYLFIRKKNTFK